MNRYRRAWLIEREPAYWPRLESLTQGGLDAPAHPRRKARNMMSERDRAAWRAFLLDELRAEIALADELTLTPAEQDFRATYAAQVATWTDAVVRAELGNKHMERDNDGEAGAQEFRLYTIAIAVLAAEFFRRGLETRPAAA